MKQSKMLSGFSLIEVLIFISILSLFFVVAASVTTVSLRTMQINEHKIIATRYAEEQMDWLKSKKEDDWKYFYSISSGNYCFSSGLSWPPSTSGNCGTSYSLNSLYKRYATLEQIGSSQIRIISNVEWKELGNTYSVALNSIVSVWEQ